MGPLDRGLLTLYSLFMTLAVAVILLALFGWPGPLAYLLQAQGRPAGNWSLETMSGILFLVGIRLLYVSLRNKQSSNRRAVVHEFTLGQVRISLIAIENMVKKVVYQIPGIREVRPEVVQAPGGITINIRAVVAPDVNIPYTSQEIQSRVQEYISKNTGITVSQVKILVANITTTRPRVE